MKLLTAKGRKRLLILAGIVVIALFWAWRIVVWMPGASYRGEISPLTSAEIEVQNRLRDNLITIASTEHNWFAYDNLLKVARFIEDDFTHSGYEVKHQPYTVHGVNYENLSVEIPGSKTPEEIVVIGAHYDSFTATPGANDNGTGVVATLELARQFAQTQPKKTLRFVTFVNEEPPFFQTPEMGSWVYAQSCLNQGEKIVAMISLETMGYYTEEPDSQSYPFPLSLFYPNQGNFLTFVGSFASRALVHQTLKTFRESAQFPSEGVIFPEDFPGVGWSDHWSFWQMGYPAMMITDTAPARYHFYHTPEDTPEQIHYPHLTRVVTSLIPVVQKLTKVQ